MLGLDVPVYVQYGRWLGVLPTPDWITGESHFRGFLQGTFGESLFGAPFPIEEIIIGRLPVTIELGALAIVIGLVIALPVGVYSAIRQDTVADYVGRTAAIIGLATPNFWLGVMVMLYPAIWWGWSPPIELIPFAEDPLGNLGMFLIPALILGTALAASTMRMTRTMMLEVLRQDYRQACRSVVAVSSGYRPGGTRLAQPADLRGSYLRPRRCGRDCAEYRRRCPGRRHFRIPWG